MVLNIADRIKYLRERYSMTQTDLAKKLGVSRSAVNLWEMSVSSPSLSNLVEMSKIFDVNVDYLINLTDKITVDITDLKPNEREIVMKLVECLKNKTQPASTRQQFVK